MILQDYLDRIQYTGELRTDSATLRRIHHHHLLHIPYENLSIQLGEPVGLAHQASYEKVVRAHRGGWCYEMNGLLQWALEEIGFNVMRLSGGVMRSTQGDEVLGNHLVLAVCLEGETWIADVGFGDGVREAFPLREGRFEQGGLNYALELLEDGYWRFHNHQYSVATDFDFCHEVANEALLDAQCQWLQTSKQSPFTMNLICQTFQADSIEVLLGRMRRSITPGGIEKRLLDSADELNEELHSVYGLTVDVSALWPSIVAQHKVLFPDMAS